MEKWRYEDILHMKRPVSVKHPRMSLYDRAAQFSPFAALTGHEEVIEETGRLTGEKMDLTEQKKEQLDRRLQMLRGHLCEKPTVAITFFQKDEKKEGGCYLTVTERLVGVNDYEKYILLGTGERIHVEDIYEIEIP